MTAAEIQATWWVPHLFFPLTFISLFQCTCVHSCTHSWVHMCHCTQAEAENNVEGSGVSFYPIGTQDQTQVMGLGGKCLGLLGHLVTLFLLIFFSLLLFI